MLSLSLCFDYFPSRKTFNIPSKISKLWLNVQLLYISGVSVIHYSTQTAFSPLS